MGHSYVNLGNVYDITNKLGLAIENYEKAIKIFRQQEDYKSLSFALNNLGSFYIDSKQFKKAKVYLDEALNLREKLGDMKGVCSTNIILGKLYTMQNNPDYKKAEESLKYALLLNKDIGLEINKKDIYFELSDLYKRQKKWIAHFIITIYILKFYKMNIKPI